eukprot:Sspe_Gene.88309::Locus_60347_Transcript_1_3_Confidence_0.333_Length_1929::g.88309::m.88309
MEGGEEGGRMSLKSTLLLAVLAVGAVGVGGMSVFTTKCSQDVCSVAPGAPLELELEGPAGVVDLFYYTITLSCSEGAYMSVTGCRGSTFNESIPSNYNSLGLGGCSGVRMVLTSSCAGTVTSLVVYGSDVAATPAPTHRRSDWTFCDPDSCQLTDTFSLSLDAEGWQLLWVEMDNDMTCDRVYPIAMKVEGCSSPFSTSVGSQHAVVGLGLNECKGVKVTLTAIPPCTGTIRNVVFRVEEAVRPVPPGLTKFSASGLPLAVTSTPIRVKLGVPVAPGRVSLNILHSTFTGNCDTPPLLEIDGCPKPLFHNLSAVVAIGSTPCSQVELVLTSACPVTVNDLYIAGEVLHDVPTPAPSTVTGNDCTNSTCYVDSLHPLVVPLDGSETLGGFSLSMNRSCANGSIAAIGIRMNITGCNGTYSAPITLSEQHVGLPNCSSVKARITAAPGCSANLTALRFYWASPTSSPPPTPPPTPSPTPLPTTAEPAPPSSDSDKGPLAFVLVFSLLLVVLCLGLTWYHRKRRKPIRERTWENPELEEGFFESTYPGDPQKSHMIAL